jgi:hypothetical protein
MRVGKLLLIVFTLAVILAALLVVAGCGTLTPEPTLPAKLERPSPRLMEKPMLPPPPKAGDDLFEADANLRAAAAREVGKYRSLQGYVRKITKEAPK